MDTDAARAELRRIVDSYDGRIDTSWMSGLEKQAVRAMEEARDLRRSLRADAIRRAGLDPDEGAGRQVYESYDGPVPLEGDADEAVRAVLRFAWDVLNVAVLDREHSA